MLGAGKAMRDPLAEWDCSVTPTDKVRQSSCRSSLCFLLWLAENPACYGQLVASKLYLAEVATLESSYDAADMDYGRRRHVELTPSSSCWDNL